MKIKKDSKIKNLKKQQNGNINIILNIKVDLKFSILAIVLLTFICIFITPITFQNDTFYTIKIGELIKNNGIDMLDHFSWHENLPYTYPHWLYDLCTYLVYEINGFQSVYILTIVLSVILGISMFLVNEKLNKSAPIAFVVTVGSLYLLKDYIAARAQLVTFILFIWEVFCIEKFLENKKVAYGFFLVLISLLIANLHVAVWPFFFVLFLPYLAEYLISIILDVFVYQKFRELSFKRKIKKLSKKASNQENISNLNKEISSQENINNLNKETSNQEKINNLNEDMPSLIRPNKLDKMQGSEELVKIEKKYEEFKEHVSRVKIKREQDRKNPYRILLTRNPNAKWLILIMAISVLMGLITPIKDTPYTYLIKTMKGNTMSNINEHLPLTLANNTGMICTLVIFLAILIFTDVKIRLSDLFMLGGLTYMMFSSRRQVSMFVLIGSLILTRLIVDLLSRHSKDSLQKIDNVFKNIWVILITTILVCFLNVNFSNSKSNNTYVDDEQYPVEACDFILQNIDLTNARFYNNYNYGSYVLFRGIPVFIDSRADLYTPEFNGDEDEDIFSDFLDTSSLGKFYEDVFDKYKITHLLIPKNSKISMIINRTNDKNYKELYKDNHFIIYERLNVD